MRVLGNNKIYDANATISASVPIHQRIFHGAVTNGPFVASNTVIGSVTAITATIVFVDPNDNWIDVLLPDDVDFFNPNPDQVTPSVEGLTSGSTTATTVLDTGLNKSGRPPVLHPDFPLTNISNTNRNLVTPGKSYHEGQERNFKAIRADILFTVAQQVSCFAIIGHNLSDAATVDVIIMNGDATEAEGSLTNPNRIIATADTRRAIDTGTVRAANTDSNNVLIVYLPATYTATSVEIIVEDLTNPDISYARIGSLYIGEYWETASDTYYGWSTTLVDTSSLIYAQSPYALEKPKYHMLDLNFQNLTSVEADDWKYLFKNNGKHNDIIIDTFNSSADDNEKANCYYCRFNVDNIAPVNDTYQRYSLGVQFRESI